jgi:uncharacterized membrane protein
MDLLLSILAFFAVAVVLGLGWAMLWLRARVGEQEDRLAALTRRVFELEGGRTEPQAPEPVVPPPLPAVEQVAPVATSEDWETVIGGNWLNRAGALVLVIGIALFLGYSLTYLGPAGKVGIGFAVALSMLGGGIALQRSERYGTFGSSLMGGGWAAIYFTAYAAHALEPARVISNPVVAGVLLLAVSAGMILHALSFGSEHATALAFVFSFITLNVMPLTGFSLFAALLLALTTLALAHFREWFRLAATGILLAYLTFVLRRDAAEPVAQWALWIQWLAFEAFDILDTRRRARSIFLLNACGFVGASLLHGWHDIGWFLFFAAFAYLVSTLVRARALPAEQPWSGGYEGALAACAGLAAAALVDRFSGTNIALALLLEGEMIVLAGHALANRYVRGLGAAVLSLAFLRLVLVDQFAGGTWTPIATMMAVAFAGNRLRAGWGYSAGAAVLIGMVTEAELPRDWVTAAWAVLGAAALAWAVRSNLRDVRLQHLLWSVMTFVAATISRNITAVALTSACFYACELLERDDRRRNVYYSVLGTATVTMLLFREVQGRLLTVALGIEGAALLVAGMLIVSERVLRISGLVLFLLCIGKAFVYDLRQLDTFARILSFIGLGLLLLGASWGYTRFRDRIRRLL